MQILRGFQFAACLLLGAIAPTANASSPEPVVLHAADGVSVYGTFTPAAKSGTKILLLFHQAGASRHEYDPLIPAFARHGWDTLAIDQRSGGDLFGGHNQTVAKLGHSTGYLAALGDLQAALARAEARHYSTIVTVGSSYSSSLVLLLAAKHPDAVSAVASFSPGEYFASDRNMIKRAAASLRMPLYITTDPKEEGRVDDVLRNAHGVNITRYRPLTGVHGASTLVCTRDPAGCRANRASFMDFLDRLGRTSSHAKPEH